MITTSGIDHEEKTVFMNHSSTSIKDKRRLGPRFDINIAIGIYILR